MQADTLGADRGQTQAGTGQVIWEEGPRDLEGSPARSA